RASLLVDLVNLKFEVWGEASKSARLLQEMLELAELAVRDAPNVWYTNVKKAEILMLRFYYLSQGEPEREAVRDYLRELQRCAAGRGPGHEAPAPLAVGPGPLRGAGSVRGAPAEQHGRDPSRRPVGAEAKGPDGRPQYGLGPAAGRTEAAPAGRRALPAGPGGL